MPMPMPLKSCLKKPCAPEVTFATPLVVGPSTYTQPTVIERKRFDVTTVLLVIVVVGLVFGCILIFLLFRLRRMELQLQQTTKNFNMQTVRELIAQEIQDTVELLEAELESGNVSPQLQLDTRPSTQTPETPETPYNSPQGSPQGSPPQQGILPGHFILPLPNMQELNSIFETMVLTELMGQPSPLFSSGHENKVEELVEEEVGIQQHETPRIEEVTEVTATREEEPVPVVTVEAKQEPVPVVPFEPEATGPVLLEQSSEDHHKEKSKEVASTIVKEVLDEALSNHEVCFEATVDTVSEASSVAGSPKVVAKKTRRAPAPRGRRKKVVENQDDAIELNDV